MSDYKLPSPPKLAEIKGRELTKDELQSALVELLRLHNELAQDFIKHTNNSHAPREWRATL